MSSEFARYDGIADWYDANFAEFSGTGEEADFLAKALGHGNGRFCLDVACGKLVGGDVDAHRDISRPQDGRGVEAGDGENAVKF